MSYDVHITRAEEWAQNESARISLDEWIQYASSDPDLVVEVADGWSETPLPDGQTLRIRTWGLVGWFGTAQGRPRVARAWFHYSDGNIHSRSPDVATLRKMFQIAEALNAKVQGDDGEHYDAKGNVIDAP